MKVLNLNYLQFCNMERDPKISRLFRESGLNRAPDDLTDKVIHRIEVIPGKKGYKPLIGRTGRILILLIIIAITVGSLFFTESGSRLLNNEGSIPNLEWQMPTWNLNLDFLSDFTLSPWLVSFIVAIFILVISDAGLRRSRRKLV